MFTQLVPFIALATLLIPVPSRAVPGAAWVRRQEDAQTSLTLDPAVISHGLEQDGQGDNPDPGQVRSLTSSNNFINFCLPFLDQGVVLTDGKQVTQGSCNQVPMGRIISLDSAPRSKFVFPKNGDESIVENTAFTVQMKLLNMQAGNFVNAQANYYAAPQQVNDQGLLIGHTHFVIEPLPSLTTTEPLDPLRFAFFKGINDPVDGNNIVQTSVSAGLPAGFYRICSINTAANHQPALVSNAQHGALDDCSYFTIKGAGNTAGASTSADTSASTTATASTSKADNTSTASSSAATDSNTDAQATSTASEAPQATETSSATDDSSSTAAETSSTDGGNDAQASSTDATDTTPTSTDDASAPTDTSSTADNNNGNGNGDGSQNGNNGQDSSNNGQNNGDNSGNNGDNSGDNSNNQGAQSSQDSAPAPTDDTPAPTEDTQGPAPSGDSTPTPSNEAPTDSSAPSDDSTPAPEATPDASPSQGDNGDNGNNGDNNGGDQNQGGNNDNSTA